MRQTEDESNVPVLIGPNIFINILIVAAVALVLLVCFYFAFIVYSISTEEVGQLLPLWLLAI